jgi:hypothetical protein
MWRVSDVFCPFTFQVIVVFTPTRFRVLLLWPGTFWGGIGCLCPLYKLWAVIVRLLVTLGFLIFLAFSLSIPPTGLFDRSWVAGMPCSVAMN